MYPYPPDINDELAHVFAKIENLDFSITAEDRQAAWAIEGFYLDKMGDSISTVAPPPAEFQAHATSAKTQLASMRAEATPEKLGDGSFLKKWGPILGPIILKILGGLLGGAAGA